MQKSSSVLLLCGCVLLSIALGIGISLLISHFFGLQPLVTGVNPEITPKTTDHWYLRMVVIGVEHAFTFLVPAIFFWYVYENKTWGQFSIASVSRVSSVWMVIAIVIILIPVNQIIIHWNQNIRLPEILKEFESWMRFKEQEKGLLTQRLLNIHLFSELLVVLTVFGLIGPIGEEIFFRGVLQTKLKDWGLSSISSIWAAAMIFSLIHFQFYGFFPRLLLGALFGYLFLWSGNIWVPILAHIVNNSLFVLTAFAHQNRPSLDRYFENFNWIGSVVSLILSAGMLFFFRSKNYNPKAETTIQ